MTVCTTDVLPETREPVGLCMYSKSLLLRPDRSKCVVWSHCVGMWMDVIHTVLPALTLDFSVSHMDEAGREALTSHKLLTVKSFKSQVVWFLLNKALCHCTLLFDGFSAIT